MESQASLRHFRRTPSIASKGYVGPSGEIAFVDTENQSAKLYSNLTEFYHCDLTPSFHYVKFIETIKEAENAGFGAVIIGSMSHFWQGILDEKSAIDRKGGNQYTNWNVPTAHFNETMQCVLQSKLHVLCCFRSKQEYVLSEETNAKGKAVQVPRKIGLGPVFRDGADYEFSTVLEIASDHTATATKDRTGLFADQTFKIDERTGTQIKEWLSGTTPLVPPVMHNAGNLAEHGTETSDFLELIENANSKTTLSEVGLKIAASTLPEVQKSIIRTAYRDKLSVLA